MFALSIKATCTALITHSSAGPRIREANATDSFRRGILSHISLLREPLLLPSNVFPLPTSFSTFLLSAASSFTPLFLPALIFLLVCWQRPGRSNCGFWRSPCVWSGHGRCQGGHVHSSLALCRGWLWSMDGWMDGWVGMWLLACTHLFFFLLMAYSCFAPPQPVWTNNCFLQSVFLLLLRLSLCFHIQTLWNFKPRSNIGKIT